MTETLDSALEQRDLRSRAWLLTQGQVGSQAASELSEWEKRLNKSVGWTTAASGSGQAAHEQVFGAGHTRHCLREVAVTDRGFCADKVMLDLTALTLEAENQPWLIPTMLV